MPIEAGLNIGTILAGGGGAGLAGVLIWKTVDKVLDIIKIRVAKNGPLKKSKTEIEHDQLVEKIIKRIPVNGNAPHKCYQEKNVEKLKETAENLTHESQGLKSEIGTANNLTRLLISRVDDMEESHTRTQTMLTNTMNYLKGTE